MKNLWVTFGVLTAFSLPAVWGDDQTARSTAPSTSVAAGTTADSQLQTLVRILDFVTWPELPRGPNTQVVGVLGDPAVAVRLRERLTTAAGDERWQVRHFSSLDGYQPCQVLFVTADVNPRLQSAVLRYTRGWPVLVVGESPGLAARGAAANVLRDAGGCRLELNLEALRRQQLRPRAELLTVATLVSDQTLE